MPFARAGSRGLGQSGVTNTSDRRSHERDAPTDIGRTQVAARVCRTPRSTTRTVIDAGRGDRGATAQLLGLPWRNIRLASRRISLCAGWVEGPGGPVLAPTKTKRRHVVDLDEQSCRLLAKRAAAASGSSREAFIFSDDDGATAWKPNRVTKSFLRHRRRSGTS